MAVCDNLEGIYKTIEETKASFNIEREITLIAVSKTYPYQKVAEASSCGQIDFGENKVLEGIEKIDVLKDKKLKWHLIGHLQTNKASKAVRYYDVIHSVDSIKLATKLNDYALLYEKKPEIFIQVNTTEEEAKSGCDKSQVFDVAGFIIKECAGLSLKGLMTIGPLFGNNDDIRKSFSLLRRIRDELSDKLGKEYFNFLSMGMSGDYKIAIEEGATHLRVGSAIFGERK
jgi:pyridoxal phosphate enzyme (YggS family)